VIVILPARLPATLGLKTIGNSSWLPGLTVIGKACVMTENSDPRTANDSRVIGALPDAVKVNVCVAAVPTVTLLKLTFFADTNS
jgi:hypothetical protein